MAEVTKMPRNWDDDRFLTDYFSMSDGYIPPLCVVHQLNPKEKVGMPANFTFQGISVCGECLPKLVNIKNPGEPYLDSFMKKVVVGNI